MVGARVLNLDKKVLLIFEDYNMKENIAEAKKWIESYLRLQRMGQVGMFLSEEYKLFQKRYTEEQKREGYRDGLTLMDWCVVKAQEALGG